MVIAAGNILRSSQYLPGLFGESFWSHHYLLLPSKLFLNKLVSVTGNIGAFRPLTFLYHEPDFTIEFLLFIIQSFLFIPFIPGTFSRPILVHHDGDEIINQLTVN